MHAVVVEAAIFEKSSYPSCTGFVLFSGDGAGNELARRRLERQAV
jgi:hypothetical protein